MKAKSDEFKMFVVFLSLVFSTIIVFSFVLFGITGLRIIFGLIFISLPFYIMLSKFEISESEKLIFAILLGLTIFPSLVYILGLLISFRIAIILTFLALMLMAFALKKYKLKIN
ncbi:hypothetical protein HYX05_02415 [Candidatus Woesearchaeota archaeon]|nr:hypothetical protein [Candidatus Woesearchaeota archaeon]